MYNLNQEYAMEVRKTVAEQSDASQDLIKDMKLLNLENIYEKFKLIEEKIPSYNVFIPYTEEAVLTWQEYCRVSKELKGFERKQAIKKFMPALLQYVTRFPAKYYDPPVKQQYRYVICESNWQQYYSLDTGFILPSKALTAFF